MTTTTKLPHLDAATERVLAVRADVDPRTIRRAYRGLPVCGASGRRAQSAVREWLAAVQQQP